jgi:hypothetical protein
MGSRGDPAQVDVYVYLETVADIPPFVCEHFRDMDEGCHQAQPSLHSSRLVRHDHDGMSSLSLFKYDILSVRFWFLIECLSHKSAPRERPPRDLWLCSVRI